MTILDYNTEKHDQKLLEQFEQERGILSSSHKLRKSTNSRVMNSMKKLSRSSLHKSVNKPLDESQIYEDFKIQDLKKLESPLWLTCFSCAFTFNAVACYSTIGSSQLQDRFQYDSVSAGKLFSIPYIVAAVVNIPVGLFVSKFGQRMSVVFLGQIVLVGAFIIFILIENCD